MNPPIHQFNRSVIYFSPHCPSGTLARRWALARVMGPPGLQHATVHAGGLNDFTPAIVCQCSSSLLVGLLGSSSRGTTP